MRHVIAGFTQHPKLTVLILLVFWPFAHLISLNYIGIHLFPRRALISVPLPDGLKDRGVFSDLDQGIEVPVPLWLPRERLTLSKKGKLVALAIDQHALALFSWRGAGFSPSDEALLRSVLGDRYESAVQQMRGARRSGRLWRDRDRDQIPDSLDVHLGLIKSMRNHARYNKHVHGVRHHLGDVPRELGVCVDVAIRAYRNAGIDLQEMVYRDMTRAPNAYEKGVTPNRAYDHRRVRRLFPFFKRRYQRLSTSFVSGGGPKELWLPGDLLFMNFDPSERWPDHVGLVSAYTQVSGYPLLAHNAATGFYAAEHDVLFFLPLIARFRLSLSR